MDKKFLKKNTIEVFSSNDLEGIQMTIEGLEVSEDLKIRIIQSWQNIVERLKEKTPNGAGSLLRKEEIIEEIDRINEENKEDGDYGKLREDAMDKLREVVTDFSGEQIPPVVNQPESE